MAGGTWDFQNKKQPGIYINFKSSPTSLATIGERGTVAIAKALDWGDAEGIIEINSIADVYTKLGYDITSEQMRFAQQIFRGSNRTSGANKILVGRLKTTGAVIATATLDNMTVTANYPGAKGNNITVISTPDIDTAVEPVPTVGTAVLNVTPTDGSAPISGVILTGAVELQKNNGSGWDVVGDTIQLGEDGTNSITVTDLSAGTYRWALNGFNGDGSPWPEGNNKFNPTPTDSTGTYSAEFTIVENVGTQTFTTNMTTSKMDITNNTTPDDPGNIIPTPGQSGYAVYQIETVVDNLIQSSQRVGSYVPDGDNVPATIDLLQSNDWVTFSGSGPIPASTGIALSGGTNGTIAATAYSDFLNEIEPYTFTVLCYDGEDNVVKAAYTNFVQRLGYENGRYAQLVVSEYPNADEIMVISVDNGYILNDETEISPAEATWWVSGVTAGATVSQSLTYAAHPDAVQAFPRLTNDELDTSIDRGSMVFIEEFDLTKIMTDINTFTTFQPEKGRIFSKNRTVRVLFSIANDIYALFARYYIGVVDNTEVGRNLFKAEVISYMVQLEGQGAIQNFLADDIEVLPGNDVDSIIINVAIQVVGAVEKVYMTVTVTAEEATA